MCLALHHQFAEGWPASRRGDKLITTDFDVRHFEGKASLWRGKYFSAYGNMGGESRDAPPSVSAAMGLHHLLCEFHLRTSGPIERLRTLIAPFDLRFSSNKNAGLDRCLLALLAPDCERAEARKRWSLTSPFNA